MYEFVSYRVADVMTREPQTIGPAAALAEAEAIFAAHDFNALPVVDGDRLIGVLTKFDFLRAFVFTPEAVIPPYDDIMRQPVARFMTHKPVTVDPEMPLTRVLQQMIDTRCKSFPVVEGARLVGIVAREDLLRALRAAVAGECPAAAR
jgi:CBS domain-containing protein